jgi:hypothetical protein
LRRSATVTITARSPNSTSLTQARHRQTHISIALGIRACLAGHRVRFATATQWVARLAEHKRQGSLETELRRLGFIPPIVVDLCRSRDYADIVATVVERRWIWARSRCCWW